MPVRRMEMPACAVATLPAAIFRNGAASSFSAKQMSVDMRNDYSGATQLPHLSHTFNLLHCRSSGFGSTESFGAKFLCVYLWKLLLPSNGKYGFRNFNQDFWGFHGR